MTYKIIHIALVLSVFLSSGGFWMNTHFCQNKLTKTSFFVNFGGCCSSDASPCSTERKDKSCSDLEQKDGCCDDVPSFHKLDQNQLLTQIAFKDFEELEDSHIVFISQDQFQIPEIDKSHLKYYSYVPPPLIIDCQIQLQTFLC